MGRPKTSAAESAYWDAYGANCRHLRVAAGLKQDCVGMDMGLRDGKWVRNVESGLCSVTVYRARLLAKALGVLPIDLEPRIWFWGENSASRD